MTTDELEGLIRDELRAEAARTPNGQATKNTVLLKVETLPDEPGLRRWLWPALAAAAVVLLVAGSILLPKLLQSKQVHSTGRPDPVPTFAAPKAEGILPNCAALPGGRMVSGAQTSYTVSTTGERKYVFEYHCLGSNGVRSASVVRVFSWVNGVFVYFEDGIPLRDGVEVMSFRPPFEDGFVAREFTLAAGYSGPVDGYIHDDSVYLDPGNGPTGNIGSGSYMTIAEPCVATGRSVAIVNGPEQGELILRLTNNGSQPCGLEGYPKLVPTAGGKAIGQALTGTLNGSAGGVTKADVTPIIELQPGQSAAAIIEQTPRHPACPVADRLTVTLPNGVAMGSVPASVPVCGTTVHPFVNSPSGSD